jgi:hypothetical protein
VIGWERVKIMMIINANGKEYKVEFSFGAAECESIVQKMFAVVSGAYLMTETDKNVAQATFDGLTNMVSDIPKICITAIYAGCIDNNPVTMDEAKELTRAYITEKRKTDKKYGYKSLFEEIKKAMEDDDFFELSGITAMIDEMSQNIKEATQEQQKPKVVPQDHLKKQTFTR